MDIDKASPTKSQPRFLKSFIENFYHQGKFYKVLFGGLKGMKLFYSKDINYRYVLGLMEKKQMNFLLHLIKAFGLDKKKIIVADIGANMGYYSLFLHKHLHPDAKIFAFEPFPKIAEVLRKNVQANHADNITCEELVCADKSGEVTFYVGEDHHRSSLISSWAHYDTEGTKYLAQATTVDDYFYNEQTHMLPDLIKMDIEGGGVFALKGCDRCFSEKKSFILIESHTPDEDKAVTEVMLKYNYEAFRINSRKWVVHKKANYLDPEGVWGTMLLIPAELKNKFTA